MNRSPHKGSFQREMYLKRCAEEGTEPREDYLNLYNIDTTVDEELKSNPELQESNLEYDLRSSKWICDKAKASESYAQNIYAAMSNQRWQRNELWPVIKNDSWGCSWRYAGGIVADMREEGDYIDWYCSGIGNLDSVDDNDDGSEAIAMKKFVPEGTVTDEIREDFLKLGWVPVKD